MNIYLNLAISGVLIGLVYGLMALGLSVIFGVTRVVNFAHGEMVALGIYAAIALNKFFCLDPLLAAPLIAIGLFCFGYALQSLLINRLLSRPEYVQFIVLAAVALILLNLQLMIFGPEAQAVTRPYSFNSIAFESVLIDKVKLFTALVAIATAMILFLFFRYTYLGKAIRAAADNSLGGQVVGLNHKKLYAISFGIGSACVGVAGSLMSLLTDMSPHLAPELTLLSFVIVIIGGLGSMPGALIAGVFIGLVEVFAAFFTFASMKSVFSFGLLIIVLLFRPQGLVAQKL